jgi:hypothetical protein
MQERWQASSEDKCSSKATIKILNSKVGTLRLIVFGDRGGHSPRSLAFL